MGRDDRVERERLAAIFGAVRTEQVRLRAPRSDDGPALFAVEGDPATSQFNPDGPDPDLAASERRLHEWLEHWRWDGFGYWVVELAEPTEAPGAIIGAVGAIVGFGGVRRITWREREVMNLYYRFTPRAWGHGYASEMARTAVALARAHLPQWPVVARVRPANLASARVAERAGLRRRPDLDAEHTVYALGWEADAALCAK